MVVLSAALIYLVDNFFTWAAAAIFNKPQAVATLLGLSDKLF
jgi:hypothetical protein